LRRSALYGKGHLIGGRVECGPGNEKRRRWGAVPTPIAGADKKGVSEGMTSESNFVFWGKDT
jgi:hypothetical protein